MSPDQTAQALRRIADSRPLSMALAAWMDPKSGNAPLLVENNFAAGLDYNGAVKLLASLAEHRLQMEREFAQAFKVPESTIQVAVRECLNAMQAQVKIRPAQR